ncbi:exo-beta-N-acetylmuramidase NamZ family protein [Maribacter flavus]|uniref:DUF1343 domain-containing protein n=1 Tax=Maribacter flavus TaxID=1658664 RepID=A0A5B2U0D4_9FLAO|nr:DUF1343 domain-containing protein [Maribacter flavus]KAA2219972.1 DUF1343 domain-containing protein [Maribacter flavus]
MLFLYRFKNTLFLSFLICISCGNSGKKDADTSQVSAEETLLEEPEPIIVAANRTDAYLPLLAGKSVGIVANQTSVIFKENGYTHLVDSLLQLNVDIKKVFSPEHGFRGKADAGEKVESGTDEETGLPIVSLYGKNRKPSAEQLAGLDVVLFDIQDVGTRFYTYIATLQLIMEACAENTIPVLVLDRPNPNAHYVDGPTMQKEHTGFLGMNEIPLVYGMSIGEYANMINEEGWLEGGRKCDLRVIPLENWTHERIYQIPIRPSPNLPNDVSINLYPSLGLFEGTNVNAGRGTEFQFQRYGASFMDSTAYSFSYVPEPNFGSKYPKEEGKVCFGKDLSNTPRISEVSLQWILDAYKNTLDKNKFFLTDGFTKHAGTRELQKQIESGLTEREIKASWQLELEKFKKIRAKYLMYE